MRKLSIFLEAITIIQAYSPKLDTSLYFIFCVTYFICLINLVFDNFFDLEKKFGETIL